MRRAPLTRREYLAWREITDPLTAREVARRTRARRWRHWWARAQRLRAVAVEALLSTHTRGHHWR